MNRTRRKLGNKIFYVLLLIKFSPSNGKISWKNFFYHHRKPWTRKKQSEGKSVREPKIQIKRNFLKLDPIRNNFRVWRSNFRTLRPQFVKSGLKIRPIQRYRHQKCENFPWKPWDSISLPDLMSPWFPNGPKMWKMLYILCRLISPPFPRPPTRKKSSSQKIHK